MSGTKFTKGEWLVDDYSDLDGTVRVVMGNITIAILNDDVIANANVHLIAASPLLYKELERLDPENKVLNIARGELT